MFTGVEKMHTLGKSIAFVFRRYLMWPKACEFFFVSFFQSIAFVARRDPVRPKPGMYFLKKKIPFLLHRAREREREEEGREGGRKQGSSQECSCGRCGDTRTSSR